MIPAGRSRFRPAPADCRGGGGGGDPQPGGGGPHPLRRLPAGPPHRERGPAGGCSRRPPAKERKDSARRIDAAVAAVMAHDRAAALAGVTRDSIYI